MRILVIEDEPLLQRSLAATLRDENFAVDTASDGDEGLARALESVYDAIVLDVMLPKRDGWAVLTGLRKERKTPVLMLTARDTVLDRVRGLNNGADDYLTKPFDNDELVARVRALIRRAHGEPSPMLEIDGLLIDQAARVVHVGSNEIQLTAREYALLEYLALHRGEVVTRTALYDHLYDEDDATLSNLLDVHVFHVRKKIGRDLIKTRRGHGYIIE